MALGAVTNSLAGQTLATATTRGGGDALTPQQQAEVQRLKAVDQKVRQHEAAHQAAGAGLTGAANFEYVRGPDGRQYAVSGDVSISTSRASTPEATLARARQIQAAALAPADPSPQDRAVAAAAALMANQAQAEISRQHQAEQAGGQAAGAPNAALAVKPPDGRQATQAYADTAQAVTQILGQAVNAFA
jgi:hypothetical protein